MRYLKLSDTIKEINNNFMEENDNKLEDEIFECILNNRWLNQELLKISEIVMAQNIDQKDKQILHELILWKWIIDEDHEIKSTLHNIRNWDIHVSLINILIFKIIEDICDLDDKDYLLYVLSTHKEKLDTDINYFIRDILVFIKKQINIEFKKFRNISEYLKNDYMIDQERGEMQENMNTLFTLIWEEIQKSWKLKTLETEIHWILTNKRKLISIK